MSLSGRVKAFTSTALHRTGVLHALSWLRRHVRKERVLLISFHCVSDPADRYFRAGMDIDRDHFEELLQGLSRLYRFVPLQEAARNLDVPAAVVTFDDAYRSVYTHAFPVLRRLNIPATLFVPTDYIDTGRLLWWDEASRLTRGDADPRVSHLKFLPKAERKQALDQLRSEAAEPEPGERLMMNWDEIREVAQHGFEIGNHSASHAYLNELDEHGVRAELEHAHEKIAAEVGSPPRALAYPDGRFNDAVVAEAKRLGYACAVSTMRGTNRRGADPFALRRHDGSQSFTGGTGRFHFSLAWAELLGIWDALFLRRWRSPEQFTTYRPRSSMPDSR